ncbi:MAG: adenylate/guanylate cyclase domain-containing protein, partial [Gammaproteobacteria bacterium]|nr:adenylate/guanylate cyclase domain-containing protein [Gammaproteobacteria bacterium]
MQNLFEWLSKIGLEQHTQTMIDNDIDLDLLPDITDEDLKELGLSIGHRRKILTAAGHIPGIAQPVPTVETVDAADIKQSQSSADDHAEHRQLTVMFCDLAASTEMSQILSSEELRKITLAYQDECERTIKQHQGFVARYMGDGILAYFGYPQAHEDDAVLAVRAGLAIVTAIQSLNTRFELPKGVPLAVRVGIATGSVIVGDLIGNGPSQESAVVGETPNLAARLQGLAELNSVVISPTTCRLTKDFFDLVSLGAKAIKGFYSEIEVWRVAGAKQPDDGLAGTDSEFHTRLVGREEEISILMRRWEKSKAGKGQVVFLSGEPGIGKSRLLQY